MADESALTVRPGGRGFPPLATYRAIKLVVFDVDGVLTDGRIILDSGGAESKFFHVRDGSGICFLQKADLLVGLLTGRSSPVVDARARDMNIPPRLVKQGAAFKLPAFLQLLQENGLVPGEAAFVGDDIIDLPVLETAALACCPADGHPEVVQACHVVAQRNGGCGGARAICEHVLKQRADGSWDKAMARYLGRA